MGGIQLFTPFYRVDECLAEIKECLEKGWTGIGFKTVEFEEKWKAYTGFPHAHFLNSATAGLHLGIKILKKQHGWQDGDEVISTPITFVSTNHAILYERLKVVFADVDEYLCLDPADVERKVTPRTKAVLFVGMGGSTGQYKKIVELCRKHNLKLIVDAAHMAGTRLDGRVPGKEADIVIFSFHAVKNLPTADAGMICFTEAENDRLSRQLSWLGIDKDTYSRSQGNYSWLYEVDDVGYKYHGNSIMAAIGLVQLKYLDQDNAYRRQLAAWYDSCLKPFPGTVTPIPIPEDCEPSRHLYVIESDHRDKLLEALNNNGIYPGVHYRDNTEYKVYASADGSCPNARRISRLVMSLPLHLKMTRTDVEKICSILIKGGGSA